MQRKIVTFAGKTVMASNNTNRSAVNTTSEVNTGNEIAQMMQIGLYCAVIVVGSLGNLLVCLAIYRQKKRKPNEFFILNLAITDIGASVVSVPLDLIELLTGKFLLGSSMCRLVYPLQTMLMAASVLTLLCLSAERHRAIVTPFKPRIRGKTTLVMISAIWVLSAAAVSPYASVLHLEGNQCVEKWPHQIHFKSFTLGMFLLLYLIPLLIMTANYARVMYKLFSDMKRVQHLFSGRSQDLCKHAKKRAEQNVKVVKVFVTAVVVFALCLLPNHVIWLWHDFGEGRNTSYFNKILVFSNIMVYMNSAIDPFIFGKIRIQNCCNRKGKYTRSGSSFISQLAVRAPSFYLRIREMSDNIHLPNFLKRSPNEQKAEEIEQTV